MRKITKHIIHCSDTPDVVTNINVTHIREWHVRERGWKDVGYHFIIRKDGEIEVGRTLDVVGAHCEGHNADSVGTCFVGKKDFTAAQKKAARRIHKMLQGLFPGITLHGHRDFDKHGKTCPNFDPQTLLHDGFPQT